MSEFNHVTGKLPASYWRGILIFSVLWLVIGFGAAIAWGQQYPTGKFTERMIIED